MKMKHFQFSIKSLKILKDDWFSISHGSVLYLIYRTFYLTKKIIIIILENY